nr:DNA-directed DNA/RNA polymerase mu isoform X2 [Paramormyrops kingsleyae]
MPMIPLKRRKTVPSPAGSSNAENVKFPHIVIFLFEKRMGASRRAFLSRLSRSKGFRVEDSLSQAVTHIVSENTSGEEVQAWLESQVTERGDRDTVHLLDIMWFTESMREGCPVSIEDRHRLRVPEPSTQSAGNTMDSYACRRRTPLQHHNMVLTDALQLLSENAEFCENEGRSVAFKRASAVLKALQGPVCSLEDLRGLPCLGEHSRRVIKEILEDGVSSEVECTQQSEKYQAMKALTGIFGVGVKTAQLWFWEGIRRPADLQTFGKKLNRAQAAGMLYYEDLSTPVTRAEADLLQGIVGEAVGAVLPGARITLTGGFRRPASSQTGSFLTVPGSVRTGGSRQAMMSISSSLTLKRVERRSYCPRSSAGWRHGICCYTRKFTRTRTWRPKSGQPVPQVTWTALNAASPFSS